ncbi:ABC transporter ATP-binding protein [Pseudonocardia sp.]|uniref:ABC transporter ATP-binding protein n=1 Tax=Pseudonocardia sp. TaxID=60912 RepID=UPI002636A8BA|nr:ABC transporter ATP-binding protein [Pseudonocardia sp.]
MITVRGLEKRFGAGGRAAVDGIDLAVPQGAFLVLLGPSGCGKTTTLRMLAGLERPTAGEIRFGDRVVVGVGTVVPPSRRGAGLVFQSYALWPHMTVRANVEWPLKVAGTPGRSERVAEVLDLLSIGELAARYPGEISGGQQQRVAIARMIAPRPSVLLFDEPLSNLDAKLRVETRAELLAVHRATGATSVYVTHDQVEAMTMATHVALMREGRVEQFGAPLELVRRPATAFVATFMGTPPANLIDGPGGERHMYRAESLRLDPAGDLETRYTETTPLAGRYVVAGVRDGQRISVVTDAPPRLALGDVMRVALPDRPDAVFDAATGLRR